MTETAWEDEWERVLWKKKTYPDNYVPETFLSSLSRNANFRPYTYWYLVRSSFAISQHLATIVIFVAIFVQLNDRRLDPRALVWASVATFLAGWSVWELLDCCSSGRALRGASANTSRAKIVKSSILVFLALMSVSPVLRTLTAATSSDSIWALSASLFVLNALLADYTAMPLDMHLRERLTSVLSMNAAISSSVVLASRLPSDLSVFGLMLVSVQLFALFPMLRRRLQTAVTIALCLSSLLSAESLSRTATGAAMTAFVSVTFVAPGVLVWAQKYKNEIRGTWDPAVPRVNRTEKPM
ncbi:phosphatidylinositol N-acetylglucosaminyltransferase [Fomitopsis serialis]|uniref:phosphatidylinositol N-acetylglucosaminyltransferase n=1 Tax=Fomitopsis serialis TaxID=139415 RepID=UPI0020073EDB|nr:phosphatidylinositol N-acetylglucosaminyltransferase [Neoantrodia serialis]KAH9937677.1 phosphatidylinositol N-acetylglucosaminyltransferase [Neoantrodia serialis]